MKLLAATLAAGLFATAVQARPAPETKPKAEVVERDANGRATKISIEGRVHEVCREGRSDGCINPRDAGLDFGNVPLDHWPGRPASEGKQANLTR
jgi:hypothetical protein